MENKIEIEKKPDEDEEEEEGIASLFAKLIRKKLSSGKVRMAEVS